MLNITLVTNHICYLICFLHQNRECSSWKRICNLLCKDGSVPTPAMFHLLYIFRKRIWTTTITKILANKVKSALMRPLFLSAISIKFQVNYSSDRLGYNLRVISHGSVIEIINLAALIRRTQVVVLSCWCLFQKHFLCSRFCSCLTLNSHLVKKIIHTDIRGISLNTLEYTLCC